MPKQKFPPKVESRLAQNCCEMEARRFYGITPEALCRDHLLRRLDTHPVLRIIAAGPGESTLNLLARYHKDAAFFLSIPFVSLEGAWKSVLRFPPQGFCLEIDRGEDRIHYVIKELEKAETDSDIPEGYGLGYDPEEFFPR